MEIIRKLWSGEFRLVTAFWVFFVLGPFIGILLAVIVLATFELIFPIPIFRLIGYALGLLAATSYMVIASVGVWRSANAYPYTGLWPGLAKICVLLEAANMVWNLTHERGHIIMSHLAGTLT